MITFLAIIFFVAPAFAGKVRMVVSHGLNDSTGNILRQLKPFANCYDVNWATWPAQNNVTSLTGNVIDADGTPIDINMVANYTFGTTPSIYSFNSRLSGYPSTIPNSTVPKTEWAAGPGGTTTMCFSRKVTNPVLLLASLGSSLPQSASLTFSTPYVVLYDGGGMVYDSNTKITGTEGYAIIMFPGDFTCVTIDSNTPEYYTNLTWGIRPQPFNINIAEGAATCGSTKLTASGGVSYEWSGGDTPNQPTNTFHTSGTYTVTVTNASGCVTSASKAVTVYDGISLITGFTLPQQIAPPVINNTDKTVEITVADGTDLTALTPQITTTPVTNTVPAANTTRDFTGRVYYKLVNPCSDVTYAVDVKVQNIVTPINVCPGNTVTMAGANVTLPVTSYAWQIQQGTVWEPASGITNSADYNTNSSSNLSGVDVIRNYRRAVTKSGFTTYDSYYKVVISPTTAQNEISVDQPVACGNTARTFFFLGNVPSGYFGYSAYQWQTSTDGITWHNEANAFLQNWTISLTLTKKLMIRRITKTGNCEAYSNVITLDYIPGPTPATVGPPVTLCNVSTYTLTGNTPGLGETGTWSVTSTTGYNPFNASNIHDPNAVITGMPLNAEFDFTWTISKSTCDQTSSASVLITNGISSKITGFAVTGQNGPAVIDQTNHTITISVSPQTNLTGLSPNIIINSGTLSPASGVARNFTSPVTYSLSNACSIIYYNVVITQSVPEELNVCNDAFNILLVGNETSGAIYQWEKYTNGTWQSVGSQGANSDYIAPISNTFPAIVVENYRRKTTVGGTINYQPYINLNIYPQINNNSISTTTNTICATGDKDVAITGSTPAGGNGTFTYQWRVSTDNNSWQIVNGATEKDFQFTFISPVRQYYSRVAISGDCRVISNSVKIDYVGYVTLTSVSIAPVSCGQTKVTLIATPPNSNETGTWSLTGPAGYNPFNSTNMHNPEVTLINVPVDVDIKFSWSIVQTVCGASSQGSNSVHISSKPIVSAGNEVVIEIGEKATLNGSVSPNTTYVWSPAAGLSNTTTLNPVAAPLNTTTYTLTATNAAGCPAWATVKVTVNNELKIPNSITPNGDGVNDTWVIKNLENYPKANVQIFTRAGILVYSARGASKNWDATYNGKKLPAAVYYYVISMEDNKAKKSGWITVIY